MSVSRALANASTEEDFVNQPPPLKALLKFIVMEWVSSESACATATNLVDFVIQLLAQNKEHLYEMCRSSHTVTQPPHSVIAFPTQAARDQERGAKREKVDLQTAFVSLPVQSPASPAVEHTNRCVGAVASGMKRRDARFLRQVFDEHKDDTGCLPSFNVGRALSAAAAPVIPSSDNPSVPAIIGLNRHSSSNAMTFCEFERAVALPDELELYFQERRQPALADALRAIVGCGGDQLLRVSRLSSDEVQSAASAVCACVTEHALALHQELQCSFAAQFEIQAQMEAEPGKFNIAKLACGGIEDFHSGLTGRIGMPHVKFREAMKQEHCDRAGCNMSFTTGNYKITTTPKQEWFYIAGDEAAQQVACPDMGHGRRIVLISELMKLKLAVDGKLTEDEVLAIVLYTGPMFQVSQHCAQLRLTAGGHIDALIRSTTVFCVVFPLTSSNCSTMVATSTPPPFSFSCLRCKRFRDALAYPKALCSTVDLAA
jgi:hypothetical protein